MGQQSHFDRVRGLVSGQSGVPGAEITLETRLREDLGMDGDDGHEFLEGFADEFGVDMSGMAPLNYFGDEPPIHGISSLARIVAFFSARFRSYARHAMRGRRTLSVRSLIASARAKRWITPEQRPDDADPTRINFIELVPFLLAVAVTIFFARHGIRENELVYPIALIAIWAYFALSFFRTLRLLRRLDAAASFEEQAANSDFTSKD